MSAADYAVAGFIAGVVAALNFAIAWRLIGAAARHFRERAPGWFAFDVFAAAACYVASAILLFAVLP